MREEQKMHTQSSDKNKGTCGNIDEIEYHEEKGQTTVKLNQNMKKNKVGHVMKLNMMKKVGHLTNMNNHFQKVGKWQVPRKDRVGTYHSDLFGHLINDFSWF